MTTCCIFERVWSEHLLVHLDRAEKRPIALLPITPSLIRRVLPSAFNSFCLSIEWRPNTICLKRAGREFTMHCTWKQNWIQKRNEGGDCQISVSPAAPMVRQVVHHSVWKSRAALSILLSSLQYIEDPARHGAARCGYFDYLNLEFSCIGCRQRARKIKGTLFGLLLPLCFVCHARTWWSFLLSFSSSFFAIKFLLSVGDDLVLTEP